MAVHSHGANVTHRGSAAQMIHKDRGVAQPFVRQRFSLDNLVADDFKRCDICKGKPWGIYCPTEVPS